jgi:hypothetical protein
VVEGRGGEPFKLSWGVAVEFLDIGVSILYNSRNVCFLGRGDTGMSKCHGDIGLGALSIMSFGAETYSTILRRETNRLLRALVTHALVVRQREVKQAAQPARNLGDIGARLPYSEADDLVEYRQYFFGTG